MRKILVTGANGQLGKALKRLSEQKKTPQLQFIFASKEQLNVNNNAIVDSFFFANKIDYCINCAAYTNVDLAESEVEKAFQINADAVKYLAQACAEQKATLIHISTDYVFNGMKAEPYIESDLTSPLNIYGRSKLEGERNALDFNQKSIILRTSWLYDYESKNFYTTMLKLMKEQNEINVVNDQYGCPTHVDLLAKSILKIINHNKDLFGIYHCTGKEKMTWFEFAQLIAQQNGFKTIINPIPSSAYPTPAKRPTYSVLSNKKLDAVIMSPHN